MHNSSLLVISFYCTQSEPLNSIILYRSKTQEDEIVAKQEIIDKLQAELGKTRNENEHYVSVIMDSKAKQANEMDEIQQMNQELNNAKANLAIEKERFESKQVEFEQMRESLTSMEMSLKASTDNMGISVASMR